MTVRELVDRWRRDAALLRRRGGDGLATQLEGCADELEQAIAGAERDELTLPEAAAASGYSTAHLRRLIAEGHLRNVARSGRPLVRRGDLPRKPGLRRIA